jgi:hypothetical protein
MRFAVGMFGVILRATRADTGIGLSAASSSKVALMSEQDVPSQIDLYDPRDACEWEQTAQERPGRTELFQTIGRALVRLGKNDLTVLDLGSELGFLAAYQLDALPAPRLTMLTSPPR